MYLSIYMCYYSSVYDMICIYIRPSTGATSDSLCCEVEVGCLYLSNYLSICLSIYLSSYVYRSIDRSIYITSGHGALPVGLRTDGGGDLRTCCRRFSLRQGGGRLLLSIYVCICLSVYMYIYIYMCYYVILYYMKCIYI